MFSEDKWSFFVVDDKRKGDEAILALVYNIDAAEDAKAMYESQLREFDAQRLAADDDASWFSHSWRDEDCLGGE